MQNVLISYSAVLSKMGNEDSSIMILFFIATIKLQLYYNPNSWMDAKSAPFCKPIYKQNAVDFEYSTEWLKDNYILTAPLFYIGSVAKSFEGTKGTVDPTKHFNVFKRAGLTIHIEIELDRKRVTLDFKKDGEIPFYLDIIYCIGDDEKHKIESVALSIELNGINGNLHASLAFLLHLGVGKLFAIMPGFAEDLEYIAIVGVAIKSFIKELGLTDKALIIWSLISNCRWRREGRKGNCTDVLMYNIGWAKYLLSNWLNKKNDDDESNMRYDIKMIPCAYAVNINGIREFIQNNPYMGLTVV